MYSISYSNKFKKSVRLAKKRGYSIELLEEVVDKLQKNGKLPKQYKSHLLTENYQDCWECHIKPNWLLVWKQNDTELTLLLLDTGTHSDLF